MPRQIESTVLVGSVPIYTGAVGSDTSTNAVPVEWPTSAYSRPVTGSVQPQRSFPVPPPMSPCGRNDIRSMSRQGYPPAMPSAQETPAFASSCCTGCASARFAHPHEQRRPFESSGQIPRSHEQWAPRGGSGTGVRASDSAINAIQETAAASFATMAAPGRKARRSYQSSLVCVRRSMIIGMPNRGRSVMRGQGSTRCPGTSRSR